jgi:hypothetical protein
LPWTAILPISTFRIAGNTGHIWPSFSMLIILL